MRLKPTVSGEAAARVPGAVYCSLAYCAHLLTSGVVSLLLRARNGGVGAHTNGE